MRKLIIVILLLFLFSGVIRAKPIEFVYSDWVDYYPEGIEEVRIESQVRYLWFKIEGEERIETEEYFEYLEGYEKIEGSEKTFYRVINNDYVYFTNHGVFVTDTNQCRKVFCYKVKIEPFNPNKEEEDNPPEVIEPIINPDTFDARTYYYYSFMVSIIILIIVNCIKIYLVMSNRFK